MQDEKIPKQSEESWQTHAKRIHGLVASGLDRVQRNAEALQRSASESMAEASDKARELLRRADANTDEMTEQLDTAAKATRVMATVAAAGAVIAAPTGLTALGVTVGLVSAPAIITAAPVLLGVAAGAAALSAGASLYKKYRTPKITKDEA